MLARIRGILFSPSHEFVAIAEKPTSLNELMFRFLIPLALLTPWRPWLV